MSKKRLYNDSDYLIHNIGQSLIADQQYNKTQKNTWSVVAKHFDNKVQLGLNLLDINRKDKK